MKSNFKKGFKLCTNSQYRYTILGSKGFYKNISDEEYLKKVFFYRIGYSLNLDVPQTFNEKIQWLKIHDHNPKYTMLVDKYEAKKYIREKVGNEYVIPTINKWDRIQDISFEKLPKQFVLKCTHDCGGLILVKDKDQINEKLVYHFFKKRLKKNYYWGGREWPYKNVKPRVIAEKYLTDESQQGLTDYKLMCFNGKVKCSFTCTERFCGSQLKVTFFDRNWKEMPFKRHYPKSSISIPKPINYDEMVRIAEILSEDIPFVRVDFYEVNGSVYVGELTLYPGSGFEEFTPEKWDRELGDWLVLPDFK